VLAFLVHALFAMPGHLIPASCPGVNGPFKASSFGQEMVVVSRDFLLYRLLPPLFLPMAQALYPGSILFSYQ
jgi:hypothetical protein